MSRYFSQLYHTISLHNLELLQINLIARVLFDKEFNPDHNLTPLLENFEIDSHKENSLDLNKKQEFLENNEPDHFEIDSMKSLSQFPQILRKQFLFPEFVFDQKLLHKDLFIHKIVKQKNAISWNTYFDEKSKINLDKQLKRQKTYILMDSSESTRKHDRILLEKAIAIAYLEHNRKNHGEIYFRTFDTGTSDLYFSKSQHEFQNLINKIVLPTVPQGMTNLDEALKTAFNDIERFSTEGRSEILVLTDGLVDINKDLILKSTHLFKIHIIVIGDDYDHMSSSELKENFRKRYAKQYAQIQNKNDSSHAQDKINYFEALHKEKLKNFQNELKEEWEEQLKEICKKSGGHFIHIHDIDSSHFNYEEIVKDLEQQCQSLLKELHAQTTQVSKLRIHEQIEALKEYLLYLKQKSLPVQLNHQLDETMHKMDADIEFQTINQTKQLESELSFRSGLGEKGNRSIFTFLLYRCFLKMKKYLSSFFHQ